MAFISNKFRILTKLNLSENVRQYGVKIADSKSFEYDVVIVGGGIVGTATARELSLRHKNLRLAVVEKEPSLAVHQTGHNSGVIHAGIYYKPGSLKAKLCVEGSKLMYEYCDKNQIPYKNVGKLIVATEERELKGLKDLYERAIANGVPQVQTIKGEKAIREIEPHCRGLEAIWSPYTGIVDFGKVTNQFGKDFKNNGGDIHFNFKVSEFKESYDKQYPVVLVDQKGTPIKAHYVLTCCGLQSDKIAKMSGCKEDPKIVPIRGEYLLLDSRKAHLIKGNIYPVPDARYPFLGVHFTPRMDGSVWVGPNAVMAYKREGYHWTNFDLRDMLDYISYGGFRKLALKNLSFGLQEMFKSIFLRRQLKELQRYIPTIEYSDLLRGPAGVRAQALDSDGNLIEDFSFDTGIGTIGRRVLHCRNAPSPGATSSLAIAKMIADKMKEEFGLN